MIIRRDQYAQLLCSNHSFPATTSDEEKIIWAHTRGFSQRIIQSAFHFGSTKVSRTIQHCQRYGTIPNPQRKTTKMLTTNILLYIESTLINEAHKTLHEMQDEIKTKY